MLARVRPGGSSQLPLGSLLCYTKNMISSIKVIAKKKRGRPATGRDPHVTSRMPPVLLAKVEAWAAANNTSRSHAFRRLVELGLNAKTIAAAPGRSQASAARASELAVKAIETLTVGATDAQEKAIRKHRLTKGPAEFREDRVDLPRAKGSPK